MLGVPWSQSRSRWKLLAAAWAFAMLLLAYYLRTPEYDHTGVVGVLGVTIVCAPFNLKTPEGRLWWLSFTLAIGFAIAAVLIGGHHLAGWLLAAVAASFYAVAVCLRWQTHQPGNPKPSRSDAPDLTG